jgi:hypothetical protein
MMEAVEYIHTKGARHYDLRLDQWSLDSDINARLGDFNPSEYDESQSLELDGAKTLGVEAASHCMPREPRVDNTVQSNSFALGSALYTLDHGSTRVWTMRSCCSLVVPSMEPGKALFVLLQTCLNLASAVRLANRRSRQQIDVHTAQKAFPHERLLQKQEHLRLLVQ